MSSSEEEDLVSHWLDSANLSYAIPNFRMAGIVSPRSFVELELNYFEPLGVTKAEDRKRLFYLIHKVKGVIAEEEKKNKRRVKVEGTRKLEAGEGGDGAVASRREDDQEDHSEDDYASEEFQSPPSKTDKREAAAAPPIYNNDGDEDGVGTMMSTVEIMTRTQPISPMTLSSPIASLDDGHRYGNADLRKPSVVRGGAALLGGEDETMAALSRRSAGQGLGTSTAGAAATTSRPTTSTSTKERLEKELELRALKRQQDKIMVQKKKLSGTLHSLGDEPDDNYGCYQEGFDQVLTGDAAGGHAGMKQKSSRRRQSSIPSVAAAGGGGSSISSITRRRRSSISAYRPAHAAMKNTDDFDELKELDDSMDELDACLLPDDEEYKSSNGKMDAVVTTTPKSIASVVDVRSRRSSGMHQRQTVKKTNATKGVPGMAKEKNRRYSSIPRASATAPLLFEEGEEEEEGSVMSETSDLSTSIHSLGSSKSRPFVGGTESSSKRSSIASASTTGTTYSSVGSIHSRIDENQNYGNVEKSTSSSRRKHPLARGGQQGTAVKGNTTGTGSSSLASSSLRSRTTTTNGNKKRLSTIPSSSIAPLSPLTGLSTMQLDESMNASTTSRSVTGPRNPLRRRSSLGVGKSGGTSSSLSSSRPGTTDSNASKKKLKQVSGELLAKSTSRSGNGSPDSITSNSSYPSRPSSRSSVDNGSHRLRKKLNVSAYSNKKTTTSGSSVSSLTSSRQRHRLKSPTPRNDNMVRPRSKSPARSHSQPRSPLSSNNRGMSPPRNNRSASPKKTHRTAHAFPTKIAVVGNRGMSPPRNDRSVSPKRTHRTAHASSPTKMGVVGTRSLSPIRSPTSNRATSPNRSPKRSKSPIKNGNKAAVFVHGAAVDNSWATQIGQIRQAFDVEHEHLMSGPDFANQEEDDEYEMRIRVIVRIRPMSNSEASDGAEVAVIHPLDYPDYGRILVHQPKTKLDLTKEVESTAFAFDNVFDERSNNMEIYERAVMSLIPGVFRGKWASVFAYGQTGSGKTFTMMGSNATGMRAGNQASNISEANLGLYFLAAQDVFRIAEDPAYADLSIGVSLFEIYGGKLLDLLNARNPVRCLENSKGKVCFPGLSEHPVTNAEELMDIIDAGALNRSTGTTSANADSSRSHAVLQLSLRKDVGRIKNKEHGRLTFIDLAGSERGADTSKACRTTRMEGAEINTSLLALKEVIRALATGSSLKRIPFRGSKLTQVLKESFVGKNSRTVMVSCVAPNMKNCDHTLNTLRYADRVKERDSQTGKLSASVAANSKIKKDQEDNIVRVRLKPRPLTAPAASFRINREDESSDDGDIPPPPSNEELLLQSLDEGTFVEDDDENNDKSGYSEFSFDKIVDSDENDSLEEALKSNDSLPAVVPHSHHVSVPRPQTLKDNPAAQSLIATHKTIMPKLLQMLQHEMTLVNDTDINRENIDEYLEELEQLSNQQLSLLSTLRESLVDYNASKNTNGSTTHTSTFNHLLDDTVDYDDSFDLRD